MTVDLAYGIAAVLLLAGFVWALAWMLATAGKKPVRIALWFGAIFAMTAVAVLASIAWDG